MSKLSEFRAAERQLAAQLAQLEKMKQDSGLQQELAFNDALRALMDEYGLSNRQVLAILRSAPGNRGGGQHRTEETCRAARQAGAA